MTTDPLREKLLAIPRVGPGLADAIRTAVDSYIADRLQEAIDLALLQNESRVKELQLAALRDDSLAGSISTPPGGFDVTVSLPQGVSPGVDIGDWHPAARDAEMSGRRLSQEEWDALVPIGAPGSLTKADRSEPDPLPAATLRALRSGDTTGTTNGCCAYCGVNGCFEGCPLWEVA